MTDVADPRLEAYVRRLFAPEDGVLDAIARRATEAGIAPMQISAEVGKLLHVLARAVRARRILEIGTLFGYSAIWMARAMAPGGRLVTIEVDPDRAEEAREFVARAGLGEVIEVRTGLALEVLPYLADEAYDLAFIDAAKEEYPAYLEWALRLVRRGGLIAADNTLLVGSAGAVTDEDPARPALAAMRAFNERLAADPRLASTIVPVREGVSISVVS